MRSQYSKVHEGFFKEFKKIRDEAQALDHTALTMVNHVAPIYNHIASHGYKADIHYSPLREAICNYCTGKHVADWKAPPDELSWSSSPSPSLLPSPRPQKPLRKSNAMKKQRLQFRLSFSNRNQRKNRPNLKALHHRQGADKLPLYDGDGAESHKMHLMRTSWPCVLCQSNSLSEGHQGRRRLFRV